MRLIDRIKNNNFLVYKLLLFTSLFILFCLRLNYKTFYDDEIGTIEVIRSFESIFSLYSYLNKWDVSPPLSYILVFIGEKFFTFKYAPLLILPLQFFCINAFVNSTVRYFENNFQIKSVYLFSIILNPIFLLWCSSLRWYSLWVPLALYIIGKIFFQFKRDDLENFLILVFLSIMFHLSYLTLVFALCLFFSSFKTFYRDFYNFLKSKLLITLTLIIINIPQFYFFLKIHLLNSFSQYGEYFFSFLYPIITTIFGNSVFPLEIISILFFLTLLVIFFLNLDYLKNIKFKKLKKIFIFTLFFFLLLFLLRLGHKPRHSIILNYIFIVYFFINLLYLKNKTFQIFGLFIFIFFTLVGIKNTIKQENVIKNNINLPIVKIISFLENEKSNCDKKYLFTHNLNVKFYMRGNNKFIINSSNFDNKNLKCTFVIKTFIGSDNLYEVDLVNRIYDMGISYLILKEIRYDKFALIKEKLFKNKIKNNFVIKILH